MSLRFSATTDKVQVAAATAINNLATATIAAWVYPTTLTTAMRIFQKGTNPNQKLFCLNGTGGNLQSDFGRGTGGAGNVGSYISNSLPLATTNKWYFVCATFDSGASSGNIMHQYVGDLSTPPTEVTYGTKTDGTGTTPSDTADLAFGNAVAGNATWQGDIESELFWYRVLTLPEVIAQWRKRGNSVGLMIHQELGVPNQGIQPDLSGNRNHGVVTGAVLRDRAPIPLLGRHRRLLVSVASGTTDGVGSSSGAGTAAGVGASTAASAASSDGVGAATGVGTSTAASAGSSAGVGAASGIGASTAASVGSDAGVGAASGVGASTAAAVGTSDGTSTASALSSADIGVGSAAGASTCAAVGTAITAAAGSASGTASVAAVAAAIFSGAASSTGIGVAVGVGASTWMAAGSAAGICTVTGVGSQLGAVPWGVTRQNSMCGVTDQNSDCGVTRNNTYQQRRTPTQS